jgi:hypothetical protein
VLSGAVLQAACFTMIANAQQVSQWSAVPSAAPVAPGAAPAAPAGMSPPAPIYWKQTLFQIPYQWGSAAEPGVAHVVWLLVSKDQGATWQKISEAKPHVTSFSYRAQGEGEYWFAVRTLDRHGRQWPAGDYQPELRVIVDTTMPRIEALQATLRSDGAIDIQWRGSDLNLDPHSWRIEAQTEPLGSWEPVPLAPTTEHFEQPSPATDAAGVVSFGHTTWRPTTAKPPLAIRATLLDRAGNSATFQTQPTSASANSAAIHRLPPTDAADIAAASAARSDLFSPPAHSNLAPAHVATSVGNANLQPPGWVSSSAAAAANSPIAQPTDQLWPAGAPARAPFRLADVGPIVPNDAITAYGNPAGVTEANQPSAESELGLLYPSMHDRYAFNGEPRIATDSTRSADQAAAPAFKPLAPYRQASVAHPPAESDPAAAAADDPYADFAPRAAEPQRHSNQRSAGINVSLLPPGVQPKLVGSRTFALEYELQHVDRWGVSNVELWGTRDGGQTWRRFARDDDQRSPLVVTVDDEGLYGFRMVVESAAAAAATVPPTAGDEPELWVAVDLNRPVAELTAIEPGSGNLADHLILEWHAEDDNLESRPISLFYSSRPTGPWSAIATSLENTGEYAWRVERHVPARCYLRLEARDTAGNLAAFQTREPLELAPLAPDGRLEGLQPVDPTATGSGVSYR